MATKIDTLGRNASLSFIDGRRGWLLMPIVTSSAFSFGRLWVTSDAGETWHELPEPPVAGSIVFLNERLGWLTGGATGNEVWHTRDGGMSWHRAIVPSATTAGPALTGPEKVIIPLIDGDAVHYVEFDPEGWHAGKPAAAPIGDRMIPRRTAVAIRGTPDHVWMLLTPQQTLYSGERDATPRSLREAHRMMTSDADTRIHTDEGFDQMFVSSFETMHKWRESDVTFRDVGFYIGGRNYFGGKPDPNLNANWIQKVAAEWGLLPIFVGPQSYCNNTPDKYVLISRDAANAAGEGTAQALDAAGAAANYGLTPGAIIYYDMERYDGDSSCSASVQSFLQAWINGMHARGYRAGIYGAPFNASRDFALLDLDAVWFASANGQDSVWSVSPTNNLLWPNRRINQWRDNYKEPQLDGAQIDSDAVDAPVTIVSEIGTLRVRATLDGAPWPGPLAASITGASSYSMTTCPTTIHTQAGGYTLQYLSGGPPDAHLFGVVPSSSVSLQPSQYVTLTLTFVSSLVCTQSTFVSTDANCGTQGMPTVSTGSATNAGATSARLNGTVNPGGAQLNAYFQYGVTSFDLSTQPVPLSGTSTQSISANLTGLQCGTTYEFRVVASGASPIYGSPATFTTLACSGGAPPAVATLPATDIGTSGAILHGTVTTNGLQTRVRFSISAGGPLRLTDWKDVTASSGTIAFDAVVTDLSCSTFVVVQAEAESGATHSYGFPASFTTGACSTGMPPAIVTLDPTDVGADRASLHALITPAGSPTSARFEIHIGPTVKYTDWVNAGNGTAPVSLDQTFIGLPCGTFIVVQPFAQSGFGSNYGIPHSLNTLSCPSTPLATITSLDPSDVRSDRATLHALVNPNGTPAIARFSVLAGGPKLFTEFVSLGDGHTAAAIDQTFTGLPCSTLVSIQPEAQNGGGPTYGEPKAFRTAACGSNALATVVTNDPTDVAQDRATLHATVNPNGTDTAAQFAYTFGPVTQYTEWAVLGRGSAAVPLDQTINGLPCGTSVSFQPIAQNGGGVQYGLTKYFTTPACASTAPPTVITLEPTSVELDTATVHASVNANGLETQVRFSLSGSGTIRVTDWVAVGKGTSAVPIDQTLTGLPCGTQLSVEAEAQSSGGSNKGEGKTFTTRPCTATGAPTIMTLDPTGIAADAATLHAAVNPNGLMTMARFSVVAGGLKELTDWISSDDATKTFAVDQTVTNLPCGTPVWVQPEAANRAGTLYGTPLTFSTLPCAATIPAPTVVTLDAADVQTNHATLRATINPNGNATSARFVVVAGGNTLFTKWSSFGSANVPLAFDQDLALPCGAYVTFKAMARNGGGTSYGAARSFTVPACATPGPYSLTIEATAGGTIDIDPLLPAYPQGASVTITAYPASGFEFTGWQGDLATTQNPLTVAIDRNLSLSPSFAPVSHRHAAASPGPERFLPLPHVLIPRVHHTATLLADGRVLLTGGTTEVDPTRGVLSDLASTELFDPSTNSFQSGPDMTTVRVDHTATLLGDGRVLIAGGTDRFGNVLSSAELYDPQTNSFTATGSMIVARRDHAAALLLDGRVLIAGGLGSNNDPLTAAELYDPANGTFSTTGSTRSQHGVTSAATLSTGAVLLIGGTSAESYDAVAGKFHAIGDLSPGSLFAQGSCVLADGRVLVVSDPLQQKSAIFDPYSERFTRAAATIVPRSGAFAIPLRNGKVLVAGGVAAARSVGSAELYDVHNDRFFMAPAPLSAHSGGTATLLRDGRVLLAGGWQDPTFLHVISTAEVFDPGCGCAPPVVRPH